jgi:predicted lipid-binding transport protein (Tim44 family)
VPYFQVRKNTEMMNGNYGGGWMGGGGWMMIIGVLVCIAIIGATVWLVMRSQKNKQTPFLVQQQPPYDPYERNGQGYQPPLQPPTETYQEGEKRYRYPQQQERPLN